MKFGPLFLALLSFQAFPTNLALGETLREACKGDLVEYDGLCSCKSTGTRFDPRTEPLEMKYCKYDTAVKSTCSDSESAVSYLANRCYCKRTRTYLTDPYRESADAAFRVLFNGHLNAESSPEGIEKFIDQELDPFISKLKSAVEACQAIPSRPVVGAKSVKIVEQVRGKYGGSCYWIEKQNPKSNWMDWSDHPGEQGSPLLCFVEAGPIISDFFDLEHLEQGERERVKMAAVDELNLAIDRFNSRLSASEGIIPVKYYSAPEGAVTARNYVERFAESGMIPVAIEADDGDQSYLVHDLAFHTIAFIVTPDSMINLARRQAQYLFEFERYFNEHFKPLASDPQFQYAFSKLFIAQTQRLDAGTSAITFKYSAPDSKETWARDREGGSPFFFNLGWGLIGHSSKGLGSGDFQLPSVRDFFEKVVKDFEFFLPEDEKKVVFKQALESFVRSHAEDPKFTEEFRLPHYINPERATEEQKQPLIDFYKMRKQFLEKVILG